VQGWRAPPGRPKKTLRGNGGFKPKPTAYEKIFVLAIKPPGGSRRART